MNRKLRIRDSVRLAQHVRCVPAYGDKPVLGHDTTVSVSSISGRGSKRDPLRVSVTDGQYFWTFDPSDLVALTWISL